MKTSADFFAESTAIEIKLCIYRITSEVVFQMFSDFPCDKQKGKVLSKFAAVLLCMFDDNQCVMMIREKIGALVTASVVVAPFWLKC